jgi:hypothetical protein
MGTPGLIGHNGSNGGTHRPSRLDRIRPGESLLAFPALAGGAWALVIGVFASVSRVFGPDGERGSWGEVGGAALGNFIMVFGLTFVVSLVLRLSGHRVDGTAEPSADWGPPVPPVAGTPVGGTEAHHPDARAARRVARGAILGALPGLAIVSVPVVLHQLGLISSDQSQIGFVGVPLMIIGAIVGTSIATHGGGTTVAILGSIAGFAVGLAAGAVVAVAVGVPGIGLAVALLGMIAGATLATYLRERRGHGRTTG